MTKRLEKNYLLTLVCFIYDINNYLSNPYGLIKDLEAMSQEDLKVKIYINPI